MKQFTKVTTIASALVCVLLIASFVASYYSENWRHVIYVTSSVTLGTADGWVSLSRSDDHYISDHLHGARLSYEGGEAIGRRDWKLGVPACGAQQRTYIGQQGEFVAKDIGVTMPGVYYRWFKRSNQPLQWTFMVSFWYPVILSTVLPLLSLLHRRHRGGFNQSAAAPPRWAVGRFR